MIIDQYKKMKNLFLRQSYIDAWEDYQRSIRKRSFAQWDYIVLTASNEEQANAFQSQITYRQNKNVLPCKTKYLVLPDPDGKRVGSGGATLQVLRKLAEQEDIAGDFHNKRILVIHSGGDSKRVPQYSVCGKLFSPVPRELPDGRASTLFDEFLIGMAGVPSRFREGMLVLSGDVLLLFNPLQIDGFYVGHPYGITINAKAIIGNNVNIHKGVTIGQENRGKRKGTPCIGNNVWIGVNATIVGNVVIGNDVLIAPNTYINCDIPDHSIVFGNPCILFL